MASSVGAQTSDKWVDAFFKSTDPFIQGTVIPNIEKNRKSDLQLSFRDKNGAALPGLKVTARQIEQEFRWGAVPPFEQAAFAGAEYLKMWRGIYNFGITEAAFKWASIERAQGNMDFTRADKLLEDFTASGAEVELHFLAGYHPDWFDSIPDAQKGKLQHDYAATALAHYKDKIRYFQVYNEDLYTHVAGAHVYGNQTTWFSEFAKTYPNLRLGINDCYPWNPGTAADRLPDPGFLKTTYPGIKFIAMHGHKPHSYWATPEEMYALWNPYIGSGVNVQVAEFGIMDEPIQGGGHSGASWTDDLRAQYFVSAYATAFSHPAMEAFNQWGIGPDTNRWTYNYIVNANGSATGTYNSLRSLLRDKFMTTSSGTSDAAGAYKYRGFRGQYEITVELGAAKGVTQITLGSNTGSVPLVVIPVNGGLTIQGGDPVTIAPRETRQQHVAFFAHSGEPVQFAGLDAYRSLEILDVKGRTLRAWEVLGSHLTWDGKDAQGRMAPRGLYPIRMIALDGSRVSGRLTLR